MTAEDASQPLSIGAPNLAQMYWSCEIAIRDASPASGAAATGGAGAAGCAGGCPMHLFVETLQLNDLESLGFELVELVSK